MNIDNKNQQRKTGLLKSVITNDRKKETMENNLLNMVNINSDIQTDGFKSYNGLSKIFNSHQIVNHSKEFVKIDNNIKIHTNSIEGVQGCLKRKAAP